MTVLSASAAGRGAAADDASLQPVTGLKVLTKGEAAYVEIRSRILNATLAPGSAINQASLAGALGISITPLREALRRLEGEGLVEVRSAKTVAVVPLTTRELAELQLVRLRLDPLAASLAARVASSQQRAWLVDLATFPSPSSNVLAWHTAHRAFHRAIHDMADNRVLAESLDHLWERLHRYRLVALTDTEVSRISTAAPHDGIAVAIAEGDEEAAERLMYCHLQTALGDGAGSLNARFGAAVLAEDLDSA
jgi:DNA-binding GntR family transcriptional regulator